MSVDIYHPMAVLCVDSHQNSLISAKFLILSGLCDIIREMVSPRIATHKEHYYGKTERVSFKEFRLRCATEDDSFSQRAYFDRPAYAVSITQSTIAIFTRAVLATARPPWLQGRSYTACHWHSGSGRSTCVPRINAASPTYSLTAPWLRGCVVSCESYPQRKGQWD